MGLLTIKGRERRFKYLGLGEYNKANILKFQKKAFKDKKWHDGIYGEQTDNALRTFFNVRKVTKNFEPSEFRCSCGKCSGYPNFMKQVELKHLQKIRDHYGKPMDITSGLRCATENSRVGGIPNSTHMLGYAADFHISGVTDTVSQRKAAQEWIKTLPNHQFTYGSQMKGTDGLYREALGMGNAMHTETHAPEKKTKKTTKKTEVSPYYSEKVIIGQACANESGKLPGGKAGDQTKGEVRFSNWSASYGWIYVFRAKDKATRLKIAQAMMDTVNNNNIGYDTQKPDRYTAWDEAEKLNGNIKKISKKCETTCSQAVSMCLRSVGISKTYAQRHYDIATMTKVLPKCNKFVIYRDKSHTALSKYLQPGDILLSSHHTAVVVKSPNIPK